MPDTPSSTSIIFGERVSFKRPEDERGGLKEQGKA